MLKKQTTESRFEQNEEYIMKKVALLLVVVLSITLIFSACTPSYTWEDAEKDVERLKEIGFEIYIENTEEEREYHSESYNKDFEREGKDLRVELVNICGLVINWDIIIFKEFKTEKQAKAMYELYIESGSAQKVVRFGKIVINTNAQEAMELLGYNFK